MCVAKRTSVPGAREQGACEAQRQPARHRRHATSHPQCDQLVQRRTRTTTSTTTCSVISVQHSRCSLTRGKKALLGVSMLVCEGTAQGIDARRQHTVTGHPGGVRKRVSSVMNSAIQLVEIRGGGRGGAAGHQSADRIPNNMQKRQIVKNFQKYLKIITQLYLAAKRSSLERLWCK